MLKVLLPVGIYQTFSKKISLLVMFLFFMTGCAHQNYLDEGKRLINSNRYEAAVEQFTLALREEPNDANTKNNLNIAKNELHKWALALTPKADTAFHANQLGKALLLYGKSAQITKDPHSVKRYKEVYSILRSRSIVNADVVTNGLGFNNSTFAAIDGIITHHSAKDKLSFSQSNPIFEIQQSTQEAVTQYISGTQLIANPALVELQHKLQYVSRQKRSYQQDINEYKNKRSNEQSKIQKLSSQLERIDRSLLASNLSGEQQKTYTNQASSIRNKLTNTKKKEKSAQKNINKAKQSYLQSSNDINHIASALSITPAVVEVPVYSDYIYQQKVQKNVLSGVMHLRVNNITRTATINVASEDISHPAHPTINLAENPMQVLNQQQLTPQYNNELLNIGTRLINELIAEKKSTFLYKAQDASNLEKKLTFLVQHGLITHEKTSPKIVAQLNTILTTEFGHGGRFNINQLLHLY